MSRAQRECEGFLRHCCEQMGCLWPRKSQLHSPVQGWQLQFLQGAEGQSVLEQAGLGAELCLGHHLAVLGGR